MREAPSYELSYIQGYDKNNAEKTLAGSFLQKSHLLLEQTLLNSDGIETILEVGAGSGHHFPYVKKTFSKYIMTDGSPEMLGIASEKYSREVSSGLMVIEQQDATRLSYADDSVDRLIATHVLEHLSNPVNVLKEWNRVVRPGGVISIVLPCDPGLLWRLGRHFGPRRNAQKLGLAYDYLQAAEHVNSIFNLVVFIRHHFESLSESWYPARLAVPDLNLFYICHIKTIKS
ncbi:class I SAM-dependent methyltransferase [Methylobacter sp.]|uniref:class I SAM-dependent methyltransferase n=1 Tax=Methylobacter sp. TaxID=2051955 RepID=UPI0024872FC3|nr:class I SAM-dependent methyltransferase [Methylobacter sp.]MDI1276635.1 class I SAM-dependent methyltransferase [Methylobacter sp.]MDI1357258.1 class I SAM-dependent methyltransferase [Methylobacter sp.]